MQWKELQKHNENTVDDHHYLPRILSNTADGNLCARNTNSICTSI